MEEWKKIDGFSYEISNFGNVASLNYHSTGQRQLLKPLNRGEYLSVELYDGTGFSTRQNIHRLVALEFIENPDPENNIVVDHIDGKKHNNRAENLRWIDYSGNGYNKPFRGNMVGHQYISKKPCGSYQIRTRGFNKTFKTLSEAIVARDNFLKNI